MSDFAPVVMTMMQAFKQAGEQNNLAKAMLEQQRRFDRDVSTADDAD